MAELAVLVLPRSAKTGEVREAWLEAGVLGIALFSCIGLAQPESRPNLPDNGPLFPSLRHLLRGREEPCEMLFAIVPDGFDVEALAAATGAVTGPLDEPNRGLLLVVPVRRVWGLRPKEAYGTIPAS